MEEPQWRVADVAARLTDVYFRTLGKPPMSTYPEDVFEAFGTFVALVRDSNITPGKLPERRAEETPEPPKLTDKYSLAL